MFSTEPSKSLMNMILYDETEKLYFLNVCEKTSYFLQILLQCEMEEFFPFHIYDRVSCGQ